MGLVLWNLIRWRRPSCQARIPRGPPGPWGGSSILGDEVSARFCLAARDDLFVGGNSIEEALSNWDQVLTKLEKANLKVTARKVRVFLEDTEVFGHRKPKLIP